MTIALLLIALVVWVPIREHRRCNRHCAEVYSRSNARVLEELKRIAKYEPHRIIETINQ